VKFTVNSAEPWPYQRCYCSICRKTSGGEYMINIGGDYDTLEVEGRDHVSVFRATIDRDGELVHSKHERHFCRKCGCHLWAWHPNWPEIVHPVAGVIDTPLPKPPALVHIWTESAPDWASVNPGPDDEVYERYPKTSLADWHKEHGYEDPK
jgi:hypothetical protein